MWALVGFGAEPHSESGLVALPSFSFVARPPPGSARASPSRRQRLGGTCASGGFALGGCPVGSLRCERQYRGDEPPGRAGGKKEVAWMGEEGFALRVGIDWGSEASQVWVMDAGGKRVWETCVKHEGAAIAGFLDELARLCDGHPERLAIGIEIPRGAIVEAAVERN